MVQEGGTSVLAETSEIYGAEHLLTQRASSTEVGERLVDMIHWWEDYTAKFGATIDNNPSHGNKEGGLLPCCHAMGCYQWSLRISPYSPPTNESCRQDVRPLRWMRHAELAGARHRISRWFLPERTYPLLEPNNPKLRIVWFKKGVRPFWQKPARYTVPSTC